ncbi:phage tail protein [Oscillochloris sp. ZM17-4]|uniref:phage tail protein n=1 Tax=Oscillochloris sp. ZM17-4 TaxID=2866714 RepID=UPI001C72E513|nr:phage tail protein [Oscillochloris sp. ZM17-4]MBX0331312.1 phage tail protein [Oscillochloris sp. ZM17-4]
MPGFTDPFRSQTFYIEFSPHFTGAVLKVSGLAYEREVKTVEQATSSGRIIINQLPGKYMPATLTITKAITSNKGFWEWRKKVLEMTDISKIRVNGTITAYDYANGNVTMQWHVVNAWPSRIKGPTLNVEADSAQEEIEICYEELKQVEG